MFASAAPCQAEVFNQRAVICEAIALPFFSYQLESQGLLLVSFCQCFAQMQVPKYLFLSCETLEKTLPKESGQTISRIRTPLVVPMRLDVLSNGD